MRKRINNPYYNQCKYLRYIYPKTSNINANYVVAWCEKFMINEYRIKDLNGERIEMCCISNSPYISKNCKGFRSKETMEQTKLFE